MIPYSALNASYRPTQFLLLCPDLRVAAVRKLQINQFSHTIPQLNHPLDALLRRLIEYRDGSSPNFHGSKPDRSQAHTRSCAHRDQQEWFVSLVHVRFGQFYPFIFCRRCSALPHGAAARGSAPGIGSHVVSFSFPYMLLSHCHPAQHHVGMIDKVAVDGDAVRRLPQMDPIRLYVDGMFPLLKKENIRCDFRSGVGFEGVVRQTDRAPSNSARCAIYLRTSGDALSIVPLDVMNAITPPGRTCSSVLARK